MAAGKTGMGLVPFPRAGLGVSSCAQALRGLMDEEVLRRQQHYREITPLGNGTRCDFVPLVNITKYQLFPGFSKSF
ncbi:hypothetical protein AV530_003160 [Patagioenas fasciata monilis]|uniref:Uncharacterized protein n=1 Tax=Patagioenas fasciata monilis TaxID=372326 RepID=A0A1V4KVY1_PATFA|nr:hypothetical protein AV530_003160 [Patagioenas fasciata monilis]